MQPQIIVDAYDEGANNKTKRRVYKDSSTVCLIPTRGVIPWKVVQTWWNMMSPMNQQFIRIGAVGMEVGAAYSSMIEQVLNSPLADWKYILTLEEDNMPPPDGLLKLIEAMDDHPEFAAIGGLYWTKGEAGQPMIYGDPNEHPMNFRPIPPVPGEIVECNGLGMGFTLFRIEMFKDERIPRPWFETVQRYEPGVGSAAYTQDLFFFEKARQAGYRFAAHCGCLVGHYDISADITW